MQEGIKMSNIQLSDDVIEQIQEIAQRENRSPDSVILTLLAQYRDDTMDDDEYYSDAQIRRRMYERARRYWQEIGHHERLQLSDADLDEQFWIFDQEGIPRLKSEQGSIEVPNDDLLSMALILSDKLNIHSGRKDTAANFDEAVKDVVRKKRASKNEG